MDLRVSDIQRSISELNPWFHNLHLPDGSQTAPDHFLGDFPAYKWLELAPHLPADMDGWEVLDVGCNAGYYSLELAKRGARVTAIDLNAHYLRQARWAAELFGLADRIEFRQMQVYQLAQLPQQFDLVLFLGVFYHLRYPLLGLDIVARKARRLMAFQSLSMPGASVAEIPDDLSFDDRARLGEPGWPQMAFIEKSLAGDPTNWWAPNHAAVLSLLRATGMRVVAQPGTEVYLCEPDPELPPPDQRWEAEEYRCVTGAIALAENPAK